ncbi:MAG: hypothetical protein A2231_02510 [Candidatus Firestonebacteria bacterium RIFOXYA2_FULL_40_8]|nr:MAG: hypothetical protein A2231_02510 [Candidatus Firestonebacteria bacterium RIFOXYA2_FULL_40_8]
MKKIIYLAGVLVFCFCFQLRAEYTHLTWEDDPKTSMTVIWQKSEKIDGKVKYGLEKENLDQTVTARMETVKDIETERKKRIETEKEIFFRDVKTEKGLVYIYKAKLSGLKAGTQYFYSIEGDSKGINTFTTAPEGDANFTFIAGGDSGDNNTMLVQLMRAIQRYRAKFFLHAGDMAHEAADSAKIWNEFLISIQPFSFSMPVMPTPGNHDGDEDPEFVNYLARFALPKGKDNGLNYSFNYGNCHFVSLFASETKVSTDKYSKTAVWLEEDLRLANSARYKIVFAHAPLFSTGDHGSDEKARELFAPLFDKYRVNLYIDGHDHGYERSKSINYTVSKKSAQTSYKNGTCYVVAAGLASAYRKVRGDWWTAKSMQRDSKGNNKDKHYIMKIDVTDDKLKVQAIGDDGKALDDFDLPKRDK